MYAQKSKAKWRSMHSLSTTPPSLLHYYKHLPGHPTLPIDMALDCPNTNHYFCDLKKKEIIILLNYKICLLKWQFCPHRSQINAQSDKGYFFKTTNPFRNYSSKKKKKHPFRNWMYGVLFFIIRKVQINY